MTVQPKSNTGGSSRECTSDCQTDSYGSSHSSFLSDASSCARISPPTSSTRLKRSKIDLSHLQHATTHGTTSQHKKDRISSLNSYNGCEMDDMGIKKGTARTHPTCTSGHKEIPPMTFNTDSVLDDLFLKSFSLLNAVVFMESNLKTFIDEASQHVSNLFTYLLSRFVGTQFIEPIDYRRSFQMKQQEQHEGHEDDEPEPLLSPAKVTQAPASNPKDEWGHFADFQDELADESSFLPSCAPQPLQSLGTVDESDEEGEFF